MSEITSTTPPGPEDAFRTTREALGVPTHEQDAPVLSAPPSEAGETASDDRMPDKPEIREFIGSFTGWEEQAIFRMFREDFSDLSKMMTGRAACFVLFRRNGMADRDAFKRVMDMPLREIDQQFDVSSVKSDSDGDELTDEERWELEGKG